MSKTNDEIRKDFEAIRDACAERLNTLTKWIDGSMNVDLDNIGADDIAKAAAAFHGILSILPKHYDMAKVSVWDIARIHNSYGIVDIVLYPQGENEISLYYGDYTNMPKILKNIPVNNFCVNNYDATLRIEI